MSQPGSGSTATSSGTSPASAPTQRNRSGAIVAVCSVIVAVLGVIAAVIGLVSASNSSNKADQATAQVSSASVTIETLTQAASVDQSELQSASAVITSLSAELESQLAVNASLSSQLEISSMAPNSGETSSTGAVHGIWHGPTQIRLTSGGDGVDLDAPKSDDRWVGKSSELYVASDTMQLSGGRAVNVGTEEPTYDDCNKPRGYAAYGPVLKDLAAQTYICAISNEERFSVIYYKEVGNNYVDVIVTTYE